jgi:hypothetical protein
MGICKQARVRGMNHQLIVLGVVDYPTEKIGEDVADAVADNFSEEEIPEMTDSDGLTAEEAQAIIEQLAEVSAAIAEKTGGAKDHNLAKIASSFSIKDAAMAHATYLVKRAMEEGTTNPGQGGSMPELTGAEAQIDAVNNPSTDVVVPQGTSSLDATPGSVGHQEVASEQPGTVGTPAPDSMADVKISSVLADLLKKLSSDGTLPSGAPRLDLNTNAVIDTPVVSQGMTNSTTPVEPIPQKPHPAASDAGLVTDTKPGNDMQSDVTKAAEELLRTPGGREVLAKLQAKQASELQTASAVLSRALQSVAR